MDRDLLARCGIALYGREWVGPLAAALDLQRRTVERWRDGTHQPLDPETWPRIKAELREALAVKNLELIASRAQVLELIRALECTEEADSRMGGPFPRGSGPP